MNSKLKGEKEQVKKTLDDWFKAMTNKDIAGIYKPISAGYIQHLPDTAPIVGLDGFKGVIEHYLPMFGPTTHVESAITVSGSGDLAYAIGRHDHVILDKSGNTTSIDKHFIVLKKVNGAWLIDGISEMN